MLLASGSVIPYVCVSVTPAARPQPTHTPYCSWRTWIIVRRRLDDKCFRIRIRRPVSSFRRVFLHPEKLLSFKVRVKIICTYWHMLLWTYTNEHSTLIIKIIISLWVLIPVISILLQRLSVSLQRFNSVLLHDTFVIDDVPFQ